MACDAWGKAENMSEKADFCRPGSSGNILYSCGDPKRKNRRDSAYRRNSCRNVSSSVDGKLFLWKTFKSIRFGCVEIRKICGGVLAVLILAETGIHGIVSITDNGTANRDIYVESEQESWWITGGCRRGSGGLPHWRS